MKNITHVVADRISKYIGKMNEYQLSILSGVPYSTIKCIMQRKTKSVDLKTIILLADGLNITPSEFLNDDSFLAKNLNLIK